VGSWQVNTGKLYESIIESGAVFSFYISRQRPIFIEEAHSPTALEKAQEISRKIQSGEIPLDITRITEEVSRLAAGSGTQQAEIATYVLLICWLVGIVDAYWVGRLQDKANSTPGNQP